MQSNGYQLLALAARALFVLLAALVVGRAVLLLLRAHHERKRLLKRLPDAGMVGELRDVESDRGYPLPREGVLGGGRACDIRLKGLPHRQVSFAYVEGKGILLTPCRRRGDTLLDGEPLGRGAYALHGAMLRVGGYTLRIRLFAGLNVPHPVPYQQQHWQPALEEELYAPEYPVFTALQSQAVPGAQAWEESAVELPPAFTPIEPIFETQRMQAVQLPSEQAQPVPTYAVEQPVPMPAYEAAEDAPPPFEPGAVQEYPEQMPAPFETPQRHRRSDRRRTE